jgi:hypothetical protein
MEFLAQQLGTSLPHLLCKRSIIRVIKIKDF